MTKEKKNSALVVIVTIAVFLACISFLSGIVNQQEWMQSAAVVNEETENELTTLFGKPDSTGIYNIKLAKNGKGEMEVYKILNQNSSAAYKYQFYLMSVDGDSIICDVSSEYVTIVATGDKEKQMTASVRFFGQEFDKISEVTVYLPENFQIKTVSPSSDMKYNFDLD